MPTIDEEAYEVAGNWIQDYTTFELDGPEHESLAKVISDYVCEKNVRIDKWQ